MKAGEIVRSLRCSSQVPGPLLDCRTCPYHMEETVDGVDYAGCDCDRIAVDAADRLEELVDRCARYAEEIAVLRERAKRVAVTERRPERDGHYLCWYTFGKERDSVLYQSPVFCQVLDYYATDQRPHFQHEGTHGMAVTHWMEIPEVTQDE